MNKIYQRETPPIFLLINKAENHFAIELYDSVIYYCDSGWLYCRKKNFTKGIAFSIIEKTDIYIENDYLQKADLYSKQTYKLGQQIINPLIIEIAEMQAPQVRMYDGRLDEAIVYFEKSTAYFKNDPSIYADTRS